MLLISFFSGAFVANQTHAEQIIEVSSQTGKSVQSKLGKECVNSEIKMPFCSRLRTACSEL
jgi:hypothetical protein